MDNARNPVPVLAPDPLDRGGNRGVVGQVGLDQRERRLVATAVEPDDVATAVAEWFGSERRATLVYRKASA